MLSEFLLLLVQKVLDLIVSVKHLGGFLLDQGSLEGLSLIVDRLAERVVEVFLSPRSGWEVLKSGDCGLLLLH